jgi:hypothetical protein
VKRQAVEWRRVSNLKNTFKIIFTFFLTIILSNFNSNYAHSWDGAGHEIVSLIAYKQLTPNARNKVKELLRCHPAFQSNDITSSLALASVWPDTLRRKKNDYRNWHHYKNIFYFDDPLLEFTVPEYYFMAGDDKYNAVSEMEECRQNLKEMKPGEEQITAERLSWLIHLAGDIHQPLHAISRCTSSHPRGDKGGNDFKIPDHSADNLHAYWDKIPGSIIQEEGKTPGEFSDELIKAYPKNLFRAQLQEEDFQKWADESYDIAVKNVYTNIREGNPVSESYKQNAREIVKKRLTLAGYRLGDLLNKIFG